jgi:hypothetical protein
MRKPRAKMSETPFGRQMQAAADAVFMRIVREQIAAGRNWEEIAAGMGITHVSVRSRFKRLGGQIRTERRVEFDQETAP